MNKAILKEFAIESRKDLIDRIKLKLNLFFVDETFDVKQNGEMYSLTNQNHNLTLTSEEKNKRDLLIKRIKEIGTERVVEEAAYTWFNRLIAIRYMEIHDFLPLGTNNESLGIRVLSSNDNTSSPEIMKFSNLINNQLDIGFNQNIYTSFNSDNDKFKYILLLVCNKLKKVFPSVFDGVTDYIDLLIPENMLSETGFITKMIKQISTDNFDKVEIIGWMYQYYNQSEKDRVISAKNIYKKHEIAYATQLFTPDWIVKYMVDNSLGKYYLEHQGSIELKREFKYLCNFTEKKLEYKDPKDITFIDPCCGSGHVLVYAFELFYKFYEQAGYNKNDIPLLILNNNLYGIDVDDRAGQLSILSILLKAREYDKNLFSKEIKLNVMSLEESNSIDLNAYSEEMLSQEDISYLIEKYKDAKEIGSLIIADDINFTDTLDKLGDNIFDYILKDKLKPLIAQNNILSKKYNVVVTNPPYMNNSLMSNNIKSYLGKNYKDVRSDLFSAFIIRNSKFGFEDAYLGFMTPYVWMFISSYEKLRDYIFNNLDISSLIQLEYSALAEATVPICTFVLKNKSDNIVGDYFRLTEFVGGMDIQEKKYLEFLNNDNKYHYQVRLEDMKNLPSHILGYWIGPKIKKLFGIGTPLQKIAYPRQGMATTNNNMFLRQWYEVDYNNISFNTTREEETMNNVKWYPYNKGGEYRKWYGNNDYVVNFQNMGEEVCKYIDSHSAVNHTGRVINRDKFFKESVTWSKISSGNIAFRYKNIGHIFDVAGTSIFGNHDDLMMLMGYLNSNVSLNILSCLSPTLNYEVGHISSIPVINEKDDDIIKLVERNIELSKEDWDSSELSWDFKNHYMLNGNSVENAYNNWKNQCDRRFEELKGNEIRLNKYFASKYEVEDEIDLNIDDKYITVQKANLDKSVKSLISYFVGCLFGRYSLSKNGIICTKKEIISDNYNDFKPDSDNVVLIINDKNIYNQDDIYVRFVDFIDKVYGVENREPNLEFIANALGRKGTETYEDAIRNYFSYEFYNDHCKLYQKRPIYWLLDSGKNDGFKALIYIHRYDKQLLSNIRVNYLHKTQDSYARIKDDLNRKLISNNINKKDLEISLTTINKKIDECIKYDEKIGHLANQMINIDLDDGVKVNYEKFADILAKIK